MKRAWVARLNWWTLTFAFWWLLVCPLSFFTATFLGFVTIGLGVMMLLLEANLRASRAMLHELQRQRPLEPAYHPTALEELMRR